MSFTTAIKNPLAGKDTLKMQNSQVTEENNSYTVKTLSARIGFHEITIYRWIAKRGMPVHRAGDTGRIDIDWNEFLEWWKKDKNEKWEQA